MRRVQTGVALLTTLLLWSGTVWAQSTPTAWTPFAQLYELTETARLIGKGASQSEVAVSAMMGYAKQGSPVCPPAYALPGPGAPAAGDLRDQGSVCVLTVTGTDTVDLTTGLGPIHGTFKVVIADPTNPKAVDAPEWVVMKGSFDGSMNFSPAVVWSPPLPYGTITGLLTVDDGTSIPYVGVFVMPFLAFCDPANPTSLVDCYLTYTLSGNPPAVQLSPPFMAPVTSAQKALGYPTARFDIYLPQ